MVLLISIVVLLFSIIFHEITHGYIALLFGDDTAYRRNRLSLNPLKHIDTVGSILLPLVLAITRAPFMFGWAKPVPINPDKLGNKKIDMVYVSLAGPMVNIILVIIGLAILKIFTLTIGVDYYQTFISQSSKVRSALILDSYNLLLLEIGMQMVITNIVLAVFNLIPIPPLDGSRILLPFLKGKQEIIYNELEKYGIIIIFVLMYLKAFNFIFDIVLKIIYKIIWFL